MRKPYKLKGIINDLMNDFGKKFFKIKREGVAAGNEWNIDTEKFLVQEVLKTGIKHHFTKAIKKAF